MDRIGLRSAWRVAIMRRLLLDWSPFLASPLKTYSRRCRRQEIRLAPVDVLFAESGIRLVVASQERAQNINSLSIYIAFGNKRGPFDAVLMRYRERRRPRGEYVLAGATAAEVAKRLLFYTIDWLTDPKEPPGCLATTGRLVSRRPER